MISYQKASDPWHFSHLGKDYFANISNLLGGLNVQNDLIEDIYIGCTGVPYIEINNGRKINPNWCVKLKSGDVFRFGTPTKNLLEKDQWKLSKCIHFKWEEIKDFYKKVSY